MGFKIKSIFGGGSSSGNESTGAASSAPIEQSAVKDEEQVNNDTSTADTPELIEKEVAQNAPNDVPPTLQFGETISEDEEPKKPLAPRRKPRNQEELLLEAIPERANAAPVHLKTLLQGKILIDILPSNKKYLFDGTPDKPCSVTEVPSAIEADCTISIHGKDLMRISDGDLNPQILMLSHKTRVWGNPKLATYIFNLIAPYSSSY